MLKANDTKDYACWLKTLQIKSPTPLYGAGPCNYKNIFTSEETI